MSCNGGRLPNQLQQLTRVNGSAGHGDGLTHAIHSARILCAIAKPSSEVPLIRASWGKAMAMAIQTPRELATRLREKAVDCEILAQDVPDHRVRLLGMAEHYWRLADKIDQPRMRPGSLTETFRLAARCGGYPDEATG